MGDYEFVFETSRKEKVRAFVISLIVVLIIFAISGILGEKFLSYVLSSSQDKGFAFAKEAVTNVSLSGLFWISFLGTSIFVPMPIELFYWISLTKSNGVILSFLIATLGFVLMQMINYWLGLKLSPFFMNILSKKKVFKIRRTVNKYGMWAVFALNVIPSPSELLTFALGLTKYNFTRLFVVLSLATAIKYGAMALFYIIFF
jgi:membrane protein YqaA with SNARE-associated domain